MDIQAERNVVSNKKQDVWRISWVAYVWPIIKYGFILAVLEAFDFIPWWITAIVALRLLYRLALIRSVQVFLDERGVWKQFGFLPWSKGVVGVKWRDLDEALMFTGFTPWLTKAPGIQIVHRFTKAIELQVPTVADGRSLIEEINERHERLIRTGALS